MAEEPRKCHRCSRALATMATRVEVSATLMARGKASSSHSIALCSICWLDALAKIKVMFATEP